MDNLNNDLIKDEICDIPNPEKKDDVIIKKKRKYKNNTREYNRKYYENNKDKWLEKIVCDLCGGQYHIANKPRHCKAKKHIRALESKNLRDNIHN